jgi:hypothetical protein
MFFEVVRACFDVSESATLTSPCCAQPDNAGFLSVLNCAIFPLYMKV